MIYMIISILLVAVLFVGCIARPANPERAKELDRLADKYGGFYVFNKKFVDEIRQREKERGEFEKKVLDMSATDEELRINLKKYDVDKELPQTLSNGCKYDKRRFLSIKDNPKYAYYENKIKEHVGVESYDKLQYYMFISSTYECNKETYPLIVSINIQYNMIKYGLFGDEGRGFSIAKSYTAQAGTKRPSIFYLIDNKFVRSDHRRLWELNGNK